MTEENGHIFKSDDDSSNDNSLEEMDAVERFCNLSKSSDQKDIVNNDSSVNTLPVVDNLIDVTNGCITAHNEGVVEKEEEKSLELKSEDVLSDDIKSESENEPHDSCSELIKNENNSSISTKNVVADSAKSVSFEPSSSSPNKKNPKNVAVVIEEDLGARIIEEYQEVAIDLVENSDKIPKVTSPEKPNRPVRLRAPSLKLIEAAGGTATTKDFCSKSELPNNRHSSI